MGLHKILKIVGLILSLAGIVFLAIILSKGGDVVTQTGEGVDGFLYVAYITFALILITVLIFVIKGLFAGDTKKTLFSIGGFLLIIIISYVLADGSDAGMYALNDGTFISETDSKWVGTGLNAFYIMAVLAIGAMIFSGFKKITN